MIKTDKIIISVIVVYVLFILLCLCLNCVNSNLHTLPHTSRNVKVLNTSVENSSFKKQLNLLLERNQENFRMPYDKDYMDPIFYTAEVSMEFDPKDLIGGELPNFAPIASQEIKILEEEAKIYSPSPTNKDPAPTAEVPYPTDEAPSPTAEDRTPNPTDEASQYISKGKGTGSQNEMKSFEAGTPEFYQNCKQVTKVGEDGYTHKYNFTKNSALLGTLYENLFHQKCTDYFAKKKKQEKEENVNKLLKLNLPSFQIKKLQEQVENLGYKVTDKDIKELENITNKNPPDLENKMKSFILKLGKEAQDLDNMYLTKESKKGENRVDTIQSISNNNEDSKDNEEKMVLCLKRYRGDEDKCFSPKKIEKDTYCKVPECYSPRLVIGSCTLNSLDMEPFFFENNAHFVIKKHPNNSKRRIIYMNQKGDSRKCESDPKYFRNYLDIIKKERLIELAKNKIQFMKTQEIILNEEQKKEYHDLENRIEKLDSSQGKFTDAPGETNIDYHKQTQSRNKELKKAKEIYSQFKKKIRDEMIEKETIKKTKLEKDLVDLKIIESKFDKAKKGISSRMCLKYAMDGSTVVTKLLYEDDKRNLIKGYRSDWLIVKHIDDSGKDTDFYKIKGDIGGQKFNLSKKPKPKKMAFIGFGSFTFEPKPKLEDQLWLIKEVGDLNANVVLGEVKEETEIRQIGEAQDKKQTNKVVEWT